MSRQSLAQQTYTSAGIIEVDPGQCATAHTHGGDEVVYVTEGLMSVRAWHDDGVGVFELEPDDACYIPAGCRHEYRNYAGTTTRAVFGVAPNYLP